MYSYNRKSLKRVILVFFLIAKILMIKNTLSSSVCLYNCSNRMIY